VTATPGQRIAGSSRLRIWWSAARPATLGASIAPVLAATAVAAHDGRVRVLPGLGALVVAVGMQVGVNFANDYSDFKRGADTPRRVGPPRAAASGVVAPERVRLAAILSFGAAAAVGLAVSVATSWALVPLGALAVAAGWLYTGGPRPYGYLGLGELFVFIFFGLVPGVGTAFVHELRIPPAVWVAGVATGLIACAVLALNNLRDVETDAAAGKRTLAVRLGRRRTRWMTGAFLAGAMAAPALAALLDVAPPTAALPLLALPLAGWVLRRSGASTAGPLVGALKGCVALDLLWAVLWGLGMLW
jgi:1,4-dihydroxy-2-naphthoate octaprenyltransferase